MAKSSKSQKKTLVTFLLDRSSSMAGIKSDTLGALNAYIDGLKEEPSIEFSLLLFCTNSVDKICVNAPIKTVPHIDGQTYLPERGGSTPLLDAAYKTIKAVETALASRPKNTKVVICIQTDGEENSSVECSWNQLTLLIKEKTKLGWQFNFMGAGIDAYDQGARMGFGVAQTMSYDSSNFANTSAAFLSSASNTAGFAGGNLRSTSYSMAQKSASGDKFDPALKSAVTHKPAKRSGSVENITL